MTQTKWNGTLQSWKSILLVAQCAMACSITRSPSATGWWSGARPEDLLTRGFQQVGKDFPVFLHPDTKEEYALARTERKRGHGYTGFAIDCDPAVSLEEDLKRRDLTINAIARDEGGRLIDPYNGQQDLERRVLRHVSAGVCRRPSARAAHRAIRRSLCPLGIYRCS